MIAPLVDDSETHAAHSVESLFENLANGELEAFQVGMLHGRQLPTEKDSVMAAFHAGEIQVLVATSVVEVGVDVPNATLMTIEGGVAASVAVSIPVTLPSSRGANRMTRGSDLPPFVAPIMALNSQSSISNCVVRATCSA